MTSKIKTRMGIVATLGITAAVIAVGGVSAAQDNDLESFAPKPQAAAISPRLTAAFAVFRQRDAQEMPYATPPTFAPRGANPELSHQVGEPRFGMYAVAGQDSGCLQDEHSSIT